MTVVRLPSCGPAATRLDEDTTGPASPTRLPVKNTFIHFDITTEEVATTKQSHPRPLRRWRTDPQEFASLCSLKLEDAAISPVILGSDASSTTEPSSEVDPLEGSFEALSSLDLDGLDLHTPEQTPRHVRDPWISPGSTSEWSTASCGVPLPSAQSNNSHAHLAESAALHSAPSLLPSAFTSPTSTAPTLSEVGVSFQPNPVESCTTTFNSLLPMPAPTVLEGGFCFSFTLRLADDVGLGVDLWPCLDGSQILQRLGEALIIQRILPNGAIAAWNLQCFDGTTKQLKAIWPGDAIVCVNGKTDHAAMVHECKTSMLLKLTVFREVIDDARVNEVPMTSCWQSRIQAYGVLQSRGCEGERLHSSKALVRI